MFKVFAPIINVFAALVLNVLFQGDVALNVNAPAQVTAGDEFEISVEIAKGDLQSFSRFQQELPAGLTAVSQTTSNSDFSFKDKKVRFIWLKLPDDEKVTVTYKVKVDQRLKGNFTINGKFSYIDDNERRSVTIQSNEIAIQPSPDIDPSMIVDIKDYERMVVPYIVPITADPLIACVRQKPVPEPDGSAYVVQLLVSKERKEKFAKIEEKIPAGYKAVSLDSRDAIFTFKGNTAKFLWMNLPASSFFTVSYKLVPINGKKAKAPEMLGQFSYLEEAKTVSIDIKETNTDLAQVQTTDELNMLLAGLSAPQLADAGTEVGVTKTVDTRKVEKDEKKQTRTDRRIDRKNAKFILEPEEGIYYRVQLAAGHKPVDMKRYFKKYKLEKEVRKEMHEGWHKYSVGSFPIYKEARDYRIHIWNTTVIDDAFVSAYNDGQRITVQEALMIADQKWYK